MDLFGEPPEGLDLDEDNVWRSDVGLIILICLAVVSVVLRHAARFLQKAGLKADDYFMILAVVCAAGPCADEADPRPSFFIVVRADDGIWGTVSFCRH